MNGGLTTGEIQNLAKVSALFHAGFNKGELSVAFSPRNLIALTKLTAAGISLTSALEINYVSRVPKAEIADVIETIRAVFG